MKPKAIIFDWIGVLSGGTKGGVYTFSAGVLESLKPEYKLGLVSLAGFGNEKRQQDIINSGLAKYFDSVVIDTTKKPAHYTKCIRELGVTPEETVVVDDRTVKGIMIGNKLGCSTVWVRKGHYEHELPNTETGNPTYVINTIQQLKEILG